MFAAKYVNQLDGLIKTFVTYVETIQFSYSIKSLPLTGQRTVIKTSVYNKVL